MKIMSFLAGAAAGALLNRYLMTRATAGGSSEPAATYMGDDAPVGVRRQPPRSDAELRERILSKMGRTLSKPEAIDVQVSRGRVTLRGHVEARDVILLMAELESTLGVTDVDNQLQVQGSMDEVAPTQGQPAVREAERASSHMS